MTGKVPAQVPDSAKPAGTRSLFVGPILLIAGVALWVGPWGFHSPARPARRVAAWVTDTVPIRSPKLRPEIVLAGFSYRCSDCHQHIDSPAETTRSLTQHRDIELRHGINTRCFNCHHRTNRDALVDDWGREIPYNQPQLVCAKCHGPVYRDWLHGSHGRTNGYWDTTKGPAQRRKCIECHDPHHPPFQSMQPAPGPDTLRMGDQRRQADSHRAHNPLQTHGGHADAPASTSATQPADGVGEADR